MAAVAKGRSLSEAALALTGNSCMVRLQFQNRPIAQLLSDYKKNAATAPEEMRAE